MRFRYATHTDPPSLALPVVIAHLTRAGVQDIDAKIDTGADISVIPERIARGLGLTPRKFVTCRGAREQQWIYVPMYEVRIRLAGGEWLEASVVEAPNDYALIGRDILNRFILTANGPAGYFDLAAPSS